MRSVVVPLLLLLVGGLAGCTDADETIDPATPSTSATPTGPVVSGAPTPRAAPRVPLFDANATIAYEIPLETGPQMFQVRIPQGSNITRLDIRGRAGQSGEPEVFALAWPTGTTDPNAPCGEVPVDLRVWESDDDQEGPFGRFGVGTWSILVFADGPGLFVFGLDGVSLAPTQLGVLPVATNHTRTTVFFNGTTEQEVPYHGRAVHTEELTAPSLVFYRAGYDTITRTNSDSETPLTVTLDSETCSGHDVQRSGNLRDTTITSTLHFPRAGDATFDQEATSTLAVRPEISVRLDMIQHGPGVFAGPARA